ncbi:MAG TPA: hypothetical protein PLK71_01240 [Candidatus Paceibacterota bacterium]|nr:hypothetical protein [Candidatus Paceibacterota bacterium]HPN89651.1 hypothetical protein [Candidatus Paceibacterota bacterium]HQI26068.1 hypothetical protein [Candidatus Paceibacterota bacterium]HQJ84029.1 hypothetical protein [Candidatus Paceibacterota bacterium]
MTSRTKTSIFTAVSFLLFVFIAWSFYPRNNQPTDFSSCVAGGFPVWETLPRQCQNETGEIFIEDLSHFEKILSASSTSSSTLASTNTTNQATSSNPEPITSTTSAGF